MSSSDGSGREVQDPPRQSAAWVDSGDSAGVPRVGEGRLVRGGSKVVFAEDAPAMEEAPARTQAEGRSISEEEIAERGLLQERVIEIGETREEAIVSKQAVVREELVVRRDVEQRTERIADTVRRTEVDVEQLEPKEIVEGEGGGDPPAR
jgi:hypothetical protein